MIKQIFSDSWHIYKRNFLTYIFISLVPIVLIVAGMLIYKPVYMLGGALVIIGGFFSFFSQPAMIYASNRTQRVKFSKAYLLGIENIFSYLWIVLENFFVGALYALAAAAILLLPFYLVIRFAPIFSSNYFNQMFYVYSAIFFVVGGVYYSRFLLAPFIMAEEGSVGSEALAKSELYVKNWWWRSVLAMVVGILPFIVLTLADFVLSLNNELAAEIGSALIYLLVTPFILVYMISLYRYLKAKHGEAHPSNKETSIVIAKVFVGFVLSLLVYIYTK